jgi:hypothetical protein
MDNPIAVDSTFDEQTNPALQTNLAFTVEFSAFDGQTNISEDNAFHEQINPAFAVDTAFHEKTNPVLLWTIHLTIKPILLLQWR